MRFIKEIMGWYIYHKCYLFIRRKIRILSLYFHNPRPEQLEPYIVWLIKNGYEFVSLKQMDLLLGYDLQSRKKYVILSCDDGWKENLKLIPILEKYQVPLLIFISNKPIQEGNFWWEVILNGPGTRQEKEELLSQFKKYSYERFITELNKRKETVCLERSALTLDQLKKLACNPLITIGAHTVSHPILPNCPEKIQREEIKQSKEQLEAWLGKKIDAFSYPNGSFNETTVKLVREAGYQYAFTTQQSYWKTRQTDPLRIPRFFFVNPSGGFQENRARLTGSWYWMEKITSAILFRSRN